MAAMVPNDTPSPHAPYGRIKRTSGTLPFLLAKNQREVEKLLYKVLRDLKCCTVRRDLQWGRRLHMKAVINRHDSNMYVATALIRMYGKCGSMANARCVFESVENADVVCWTALLLGYAENGDSLATIELFSKMKTCGCAPDAVTYVAAIKACALLASKQDGCERGEWLKRGREIHSEIRLDSGYDSNIFVQSTLVDMYAKHGSMVDAQQVFDNIKKPNVVSWNALLLGYADNGQGLIALDMLSKMKTAVCVRNPMTYLAALKACASVGALAIGRKFHAEITDYDVQLVTCLVDFYAKCGSMEEAFDVFDSHSKVRNIRTWTALLAGYGSFGDTSSVFSLFEEMQDQGLRPNAVTFLCMLSCCSHAGLVEKAKYYLEAMPVQYGVTPRVTHYNCMVDILGRANELDEAVVLLQKMPCMPDVVTWTALLGACRKWKNVEIGRLAFQSLVDLDEKNASAYVLMAQIYGSRGMWEEQERMEETRMKFHAWKQPEQAYVMGELGKMVKFVVGEEDLPEVKEKLFQFLEGMKVDGEKEESLCGHTERRAIVYGILKTPPGEPIRAFKNMSMCEECHWSTKIFSKLSGRTIMVRDESRFHVMKNGMCSCGDYW